MPFELFEQCQKQTPFESLPFEPLLFEALPAERLLFGAALLLMGGTRFFLLFEHLLFDLFCPTRNSYKAQSDRGLLRGTAITVRGPRAGVNTASERRPKTPSSFNSGRGPKNRLSN